MAGDDFIVDKSKVAIILQYKEHIRRLFDVSVTLQNCTDLEDGLFLFDSSRSTINNDSQIIPLEGDTKSVRLSSINSQENVEKAKTYITSLIGDGKDFTKLIKSLQLNQFSMILQEKDFIEKTSQAVLDCVKESSEVCVFGKEENVNIAQSLIERMVQDQKNNSISEKTRSNCLQKSTNHNDLETQRMPLDIFVDSDGDLEISKKNNDEESICDEYSLQTDCCEFDSGSKNNMLNESTLNKRGCDRSPCRSPINAELMLGSEKLTELEFEQEPSLSELSLSSSHKCDTETSGSDVSSHVDTEFSSKIEFALKLGYTEDQLHMVIKKIGADAGQNAILSELIKIGTAFKPIDNSDQCLDDLTVDSGAFISNSNSGFESVCPQSDSPLDKSFEEIGDERPQNNLRPIVIDGSNVAMSHGNKEIFSCHGIRLAVDWFKQRGHVDITVFVPQWRKETSRPDSKIKDQDILSQLEKEKILVFTPARRIGGKRVVCYDDRYVLKLAAETGGIVVSNDNYRDLLNESPEYRKVVEERLLMYSFVNDRFMPPDDPLGRHGPSLDNFLCKEPKIPEPLPPLCPYGSKKCTYGNKCKYYHPERGNLPHKSISEKLAEQAKQKLQEVRERGTKSVDGEKKKIELKRSGSRKMTLQRTQSLVPVGSESQTTLDHSPLNRHSGDFGALCLDNNDLQILEKQQNPEKLQKWKNYDDKLTEYRKKVEKADQEEKQRQKESKKKDDRASSPAQGGFLEPLPVSKDNEEVHSRSSSPLQRGSPSPQLKTQEQFLSGHLLLAKKLSDEASDNKIRHRALDEKEFTESPLAGLPQQQHLQQDVLPMHRPLQHSQSHQQQHSQEFLPIHRPLQQSQSHHQPPLQQPQHQKLARQYSLQGAHDPRLRPGFQQVSYDPLLMSQQQQQQLQQHHQDQQQHQQQYSRPLLTRARTVQGNRHVGLKRQEPAIVHGVKFSIGETKNRHLPLEMNRYNDGACVDSVFYSADEHFTSEHSTLARMQSAPESNILRNQNSHKTVGRMVRQNSSSDTQLHMIGNELDAGYNYGHVPVNMTSEMQRSESMSHYNTPGMSVYDQQQQHYLRSLSMGPQYSYRQQNPPHREQTGVTWSFGEQNPEKTSFQIGGGNRFVNPSPYIQTRDHVQLQATRSDYSDHLFNQRTPDIWQNPQSVQAVNVQQTSQNSSQGFETGLIVGHPSSAYKQQLADDSPIHPTDKRYNVYYHLCGLFPEVKVREVMNRHPEETNPQELCAYIIGAK